MKLNVECFIPVSNTRELYDAREIIKLFLPATPPTQEYGEEQPIAY